MSKLSVSKAVATAINEANSKLDDALSEGAFCPDPPLDPLITPMSGYLTELSDVDRDTIRGSYMLILAAYAESLYGTQWANVQFVNGWTNWGGNYYSVQYRRNGFGMVSIHGVARKPSGVQSSSVIFTLPAEFRPHNSIIISVRCNNISGEVIIRSDGTVLANAGALSAGETWWSLDGIHFEV